MERLIDQRAEVDVVVEALHKIVPSQTIWGTLPPNVRAQRLAALRHFVVESQEELIQTISSETAKPVSDVVAQDVTATLAMMKFMERRYPRWLSGRSFHYLRPGFWTKSNTIRYDPIGALAVIGPSNFPFSLIVMQAYAALLCGNSVVLKPSERCPETAEFIRRLVSLEGRPTIPAAVAVGGPEIARSLAAHPLVKKVLFTGSSAAGAEIADLCGRHFKPCVLELGGAGTAIVCTRGIVERAARGIVWSAFYAGGRSCIGTRQVLVVPEAKDILIDALRTELALLRKGPPSDPASDVSHDRDRKIVEAQASDAGMVAAEGPDANLLLVTEVPTTEDAIRRVNTSRSGLSASIWSEDAADAGRLAKQLEVGMVWVNDASVAMPEFPWGGTRSSGWGRLFAREALSELTQLKTVSVDRYQGSHRKPWWFPYSVAKHDLMLSINRLLYGVSGLGRLMETASAFWNYLLRSRKVR